MSEFFLFLSCISKIIVVTNIKKSNRLLVLLLRQSEKLRISFVAVK